jgi:enoyl-CoA hydratase/carnithine racemase
LNAEPEVAMADEHWEHGPLELQRVGPVLHVWLNRPDKLNALDTATLVAVAEVFESLAADFDVRVAVLGGRGRSFSAGADRKVAPGSERMSVASGATDRERRWWAQLGHRAVGAIAGCEVPVVARIQGWCVGGGLALALGADFRIASDDAQFSIPEIDIGIPLAWGATPRLIDEIGAAKAREMILMCDPVEAGEAARLGLVHRSVPAADLDATVSTWVERLAAKPEQAVHMERAKFRAYAARGRLGDFTETDGEMMLSASRSPRAKQSFGGLS